MKTQTAIVLALSLIGVAAAAQVPDSSNAAYEKPPQYKYTTTHCLEYQVKALYAATNTAQPLEEQEKLLHAAEAYGRLMELEQPC